MQQGHKIVSYTNGSSNNVFFFFFGLAVKQTYTFIRLWRKKTTMKNNTNFSAKIETMNRQWIEKDLSFPIKEWVRVMMYSIY